MLNKLTESLQWANRRNAVDPLIAELERAWQRRFLRQGAFAARRVPKVLQGGDYFAEAARTPTPTALDRIAQAVDVLDDFTYKQADKVFSTVVAAAMSVGSGQSLQDANVFQPAFDIKSDPVAEYLKKHSASRLGADVDAVTKERLRKLLVKGYEDGWRLSRTTREIRELFAGFAGKRAQGIALYEIGQAYSAGSLAQAEELEDAGLEMEKAWGRSANPCAICEPNAAAGWIPLGQPFPSGHDAPLAHPQCRCSLMTRVKPA